VLESSPRGGAPQSGRAVAFGPGLTVETMNFLRLPTTAPAQARPLAALAG
jgi:hypothetical protein